MNNNKVSSMESANFQKTLEWYDNYYSAGFTDQRLYPNEELVRFFGRNFFHFNPEQRRAISVLEVGCGSCSNLWMIAKEGFNTYGLDISAEANKLGEQMLAHWETEANFCIGSMLDIPYDDATFNVVCDIFSSTCLDMSKFHIFLAEVSRILKKGGKFFMHTHSTQSDAFINFLPAQKIDDFTLNGIYRKDSPFYGNFYPFRFTDHTLVGNILEIYNLRVDYLELTTKTYNKMQENFQFISLEASKVSVEED